MRQRDIEVQLRTFLFRAFGRLSRASPWNSHKPVSAELFSIERIEQHARALAVAQPVTPSPTKGHPLAGRLANNGAMLLDAYREITGAIDQRRAITPATAWLVDNYYLVERQVFRDSSDGRSATLADGRSGIPASTVGPCPAVSGSSEIRRFVHGDVVRLPGESRAARSGRAGRAIVANRYLNSTVTRSELPGRYWERATSQRTGVCCSRSSERTILGPHSRQGQGRVQRANRPPHGE